MNRLGVAIPFDGEPLEDQTQFLRELEKAGYTDVWTSEVEGPDAFSLLMLAHCAGTGMRLGTSIVPAFTRGPALVAQSAATIAHVSAGNFVLGIGASSNIVVSRWNAIPFERPYQRVRDLVRFLRLAFDGKKVNQEFDSFRIEGFRLGLLPEQPIPIVTAALREQMLRLAGREADGVLLNWLSVDDHRTVVPIVEEAARQAGRAAPEIITRLLVAPTDDLDAVRSMANFSIASYMNVPVYAAYQEWLGRSDLLSDVWSEWRAGDRRAAAAAVPRQLLDELVVHGSTASCKEQIERFREAGVTTPLIVILPCPGVDPRRALLELGPS